jgi:hypothetical protein
LQESKKPAYNTDNMGKLFPAARDYFPLDGTSRPV